MVTYHDDCRPPLCLAVQGQQSLEVIKYLLLPCQQQRRPYGIDEQEKGKSALGYALQSAQNEEVIKTVSTALLDICIAITHLYCCMLDSTNASAFRS